MLRLNDSIRVLGTLMGLPNLLNKSVAKLFQQQARSKAINTRTAQPETQIIIEVHTVFGVNTQNLVALQRWPFARTRMVPERDLLDWAVCSRLPAFQIFAQICSLDE